MTDFAAARRMMVDGQVRTNDVTDAGIIAAMLDVPRERFVPAASAPLAYLDLDIALGEGGQGSNARRLMKPMVLAKLLQAADVQPGDKVLVVGSATGYSAAVLARLAGSVVALEEDASLARHAKDAFAGAGIANVTAAAGALTAGWEQGGPYDVILLDGATEVPPQSLARQLAEGGRLVGVLANGPAGKAMLYRGSGTEMGGRPIFDAAAPLLPGFGKSPAFAF